MLLFALTWSEGAAANGAEQGVPLSSAHPETDYLSLSLSLPLSLSRPFSTHSPQLVALVQLKLLFALGRIVVAHDCVFGAVGYGASARGLVLEAREP